VGAAIAAGSQAEKGIWALLVKAAQTSVRVSSLKATPQPFVGRRGAQVTPNLIRATLSRIRQSPTRLEKAVINPALSDLYLWK